MAREGGQGGRAPQARRGRCAWREGAASASTHQPPRQGAAASRSSGRHAPRCGRRRTLRGPPAQLWPCPPFAHQGTKKTAGGGDRQQGRVRQTAGGRRQRQVSGARRRGPRAPGGHAFGCAQAHRGACSGSGTCIRAPHLHQRHRLALPVKDVHLLHRAVRGENLRGGRRRARGQGEAGRAGSGVRSGGGDGASRGEHGTYRCRGSTGARPNPPSRAGRAGAAKGWSSAAPAQHHTASSAS